MLLQQNDRFFCFQLGQSNYPYEKALLENPIGHALVYLVLFYFSGIHAYPDIVWIL